MDVRGVPVGSEASGLAVVRSRSALCDRCGGSGVWRGGRCGTCDGAGRRVWSPFELRVELGQEGDRELALVAAIVRRDDAGDWWLLERALAALLAVDRAAWRAWTGRYVRGRTVADEAAVERGWAFVLARMPDRPRVPAAVRDAETRRRQQALRVRAPADRRALAARDREVRRLHREGLETVAGLVRLTGLARSRVYEIVGAGSRELAS